ncbi:MAG: hypothetical protein ACTSUR_00485, partial [Candidatus Heimdallarchaeaceae archaeon]
MKEQSFVYLVLFLFLSAGLLTGINTSALLDNHNSHNYTLENGETTAFNHLYGSPGQTSLAISEEDNLIFTNAYEGIAFIQLDDLNNQTIYKDEIGLTDVQVANLEVDSDLKLLYVGSVFGVDVLNYTEKPLNATPLLTGIAMNFEIGDFIDIDPATHYAWIVSQSNGLYVYDPFTEKFADISGYNVPAASVEMLTVEVNTSAGYAFIGSKQGLYMVDTTTNTTYWFDNTKNLPYNEVKLVKYYPSLMKTFIATFHPSSGICGGMSVLNMSSLSIQNYNWTVNPYNPRAIIDLAVDIDRELGYIASFYFDNAESGFLVFNTTDMTGIAKST